MQLKSTKGVGGEGELSSPSSQLAYLISHNKEGKRKRKREGRLALLELLTLKSTAILLTSFKLLF